MYILYFKNNYFTKELKRFKNLGDILNYLDSSSLRNYLYYKKVA